MPRSIRSLIAVAFLLLIVAPAASARDDISGILNFEGIGPTGSLGAWLGTLGGSEGTLFLDSMIVHGGRYAGRIERGPKSSGDFSSFAKAIPIDFTGDTLELRGWIRFEDVTGFAGLWQRQDGRKGSVQFDNMESRRLKGTAEWRELRLVLPLDRKAKSVLLGALLVGEGRLWVDDLQLLVDGRPLAALPEPPKSVLETDHEFDGGSRVAIGRLSPAQVANLHTLGKVWGFLKYHHPQAVGGKRHWDYELFRALPRVLSAGDRSGGSRAITAWVTGLGAVSPCSDCAPKPDARPVRPRLGWLSDRTLLGPTLSASLRRTYANRETLDEQFYVQHAPGAGNPDFSNEPPYPMEGVPDAGYRLLALFRLWNIVEYWFPYRDVMEEDWDGVLREFIPRVVAADSSDTYAQTMIALFARLHDGHANLWGSLGFRPPRGACRIPATFRFVENRLVVTGYSHPALGQATGLRVGDVIEAIDGEAVDSLVSRWRPLYAASNEATRLRDVAAFIGRGTCGPVRLTVDRPDGRSELTVARAPGDSIDPLAGSRHDHPGATLRRLSEEVAYLKLSSVKQSEAAEYLSRSSGAKCLVIDIRNYPSESMILALGGHLVSEPTPFATFTVGDPSNPGSFTWLPAPVSIKPVAPRFEGKVAILVDEVSQSHAEYTAMAFRAAPGAIVVGSTTAGADGNVSRIPLPGGLRGMMTGIGVFYPDRRPTQRVGIAPDLVVRPTLAGIRAGRDEVLEAAVSRVLGRALSEAEWEALRSSGEATRSAP